FPRTAPEGCRLEIGDGGLPGAPVLFALVPLRLPDVVDLFADVHRRESLIMPPEIDQSAYGQENAHDRDRDHQEPNGETNAWDSHHAYLPKPVASDHRLTLVSDRWLGSSPPG